MRSTRPLLNGEGSPPESELLSRCEIQERQRLGQDIRDEEWCGIYHAVPSATLDHQMLLTDVLVFLMEHLRQHGGGEIVPECGVFRGPEDYRVPDLLYISDLHDGRRSVTL